MIRSRGVCFVLVGVAWFLALSVACGSAPTVPLRGTSTKLSEETAPSLKKGKGDRLHSCLPGYVRIKHIENSKRTGHAAVLGSTASLLQPLSLERIVDCTDWMKPLSAEIAIVEFKQDGKVPGDAQEKTALEAIQRLKEASEKRKEASEESKPDPPLVVVFAHGWKHNAGVCDTNLACFRRALLGLSQVSRVPQEDGRSHVNSVVGVYLGWRGSPFERFEQLSLFNRKGIAQDIARADGRKVLRNLEAASKEAGADMIVVGHSLGGALVFTALQEDLYERIGDRDSETLHERAKLALEQNDDFHGYGRMTVLVNPAVEAWEFEPYHQAKLVRDGAPKLLVAASTADTAMGKFFTAARLARIWRPQHYGRGWSNFRGLGRFGPQVTHDLCRPPKEGEGQPPSDEVSDENSDEDSDENLCRCNNRFLSKLGTAKSTLTDESFYEAFSLTTRDEARCSPFVVAKTDETVIAEHSDIFNETFIRFLAFSLEGKGVNPLYGCNTGVDR